MFNGRINTENKFLGWGGGLSEFMVVPRESVHQIPDSMSLEAAGETPRFHPEAPTHLGKQH